MNTITPGKTWSDEEKAKRAAFCKAVDQTLLWDFIQFAAEHFGVSVRQMVSRARPQWIARPRMVAMAAARELVLFQCCFPSLVQVAWSFGHWCHSTTSHAVKRCRDDPDLWRLKNELKEAWINKIIERESNRADENHG